MPEAPRDVKDYTNTRQQARDAAHARSECKCHECWLINASCADAASNVWEPVAQAEENLKWHWATRFEELALLVREIVLSNVDEGDAVITVEQLQRLETATEY